MVVGGVERQGLRSDAAGVHFDRGGNVGSEERRFVVFMVMGIVSWSCGGSFSAPLWSGLMTILMSPVCLAALASVSGTRFQK